MPAATARAIEAPQPARRKGYTPVVHDYFDVLNRKTRGLPQYWVVGYILRMTLGRERAKGEPAPEWLEDVTIEQLAERGDYSRREMEISLEDAWQRRIIAREKTGRSYRFKPVPQKCKLSIVNDEGVAERIDFPGWANVADYKPQLVPEKPVERPTPVALALPPVVVGPGARSAPIDLDQSVQRIIYRNAGSEPVEFLTPHREGETLVVEIGAFSPANIRTGVRISEGTFVEGKEDTRFNEVRDYLTPLFLRHHEKIPDDALLQNIVRLLENATTQQFAAYCDLQLVKRKPETSGLWLEWAKDTAAKAIVLQRLEDQRSKISGAELQAAARHQEWLALAVKYEEFRTAWAVETLNGLSEAERADLKREAANRIAFLKDRITREQFEQQVNDGMLLLLEHRAPSLDDWQATVQ